MSNRFPKKFSYGSDCLLLLIACLVPSVLFNGINGVKIAAAGVITAVVTDALCTLIFRTDAPVFSRYSVITGLSSVMLLSAGAPVYVAITASFRPLLSESCRSEIGRKRRSYRLPSALRSRGYCIRASASRTPCRSRATTARQSRSPQC